MIDAGTLKAIVSGGGAGVAAPLIVMYQFFTPIDAHNRLVAESNRAYVLDVVEKARGIDEGEFKDSLCRTLEQAIAELCAAARDDAICIDRAMYMERAGC